jgi:hypothetical protein
MSSAQAEQTLGADWADQDHEYSTKVYHSSQDAAGGAFHCGAAFQATFETFHSGAIGCTCYCSSNGDTHHIWHDARRHIDDVNNDMVSNAGCACQSACANDHNIIDNQPMQDALVDHSSLYKGERAHAWCPVAADDQCMLSRDLKGNALVAAGADWDYCSEFRAVHLQLPVSSP